jgi:hypothetical protein
MHLWTTNGRGARACGDLCKICLDPRHTQPRKFCQLPINIQLRIHAVAPPPPMRHSLHFSKCAALAAAAALAHGFARAADVGHKLLFASNSITTLPAFLGPRAVDPLVALSPVGIVATQPMIIVAHPSFAGSTFADVVRPAREKPGALAYATSGMGSLAHLTAVWALSRAEIGMLHVPYAGSQSFKDVLAGEVPFAFEPGLPDFESINWIGLFAPAGTPPPIRCAAARGARANGGRPGGRRALAGHGLHTGVGSADSVGRGNPARYAAVGRDRQGGGPADRMRPQSRTRRDGCAA